MLFCQRRFVGHLDEIADPKPKQAAEGALMKVIGVDETKV
jgi:hypothetical protein